VNIRFAAPGAPVETPTYGPRTTPLTEFATAPKDAVVIAIFAPALGCKSNTTFPPVNETAPIVSDTFVVGFPITRSVPPLDKVAVPVPNLAETAFVELSRISVPPFATVNAENKPAVAPLNRTPPCETVIAPVVFIAPVNANVPVPILTTFTPAGVTSLNRLMPPEKVVSSPNNPTVNVEAAPELTTFPDPLNPPNCPALPAKSNRVPVAKFNRANRDPTFAPPIRIPPPVTSKIGPKVPK
jgi:hypothetical protein